MRLGLGASRGRVIRQLLTESLRARRDRHRRSPCCSPGTMGRALVAALETTDNAITLPLGHRLARARLRRAASPLRRACCSVSRRRLRGTRVAATARDARQHARRDRRPRLARRCAARSSSCRSRCRSRCSSARCCSRARCATLRRVDPGVQRRGAARGRGVELHAASAIPAESRASYRDRAGRPHPRGARRAGGGLRGDRPDQRRLGRATTSGPRAIRAAVQHAEQLRRPGILRHDGHAAASRAATSTQRDVPAVGAGGDRRRDVRRKAGRSCRARSAGASRAKRRRAARRRRSRSSAWCGTRATSRLKDDPYPVVYYRRLAGARVAARADHGPIVAAARRGDRRRSPPRSASLDRRIEVTLHA